MGCCWVVLVAVGPREGTLPAQMTVAPLTKKVATILPCLKEVALAVGPPPYPAPTVHTDADVAAEVGGEGQFRDLKQLMACRFRAAGYGAVVMLWW